MTPEAEAILNVFKERGVRSGGMVDWSDLFDVLEIGEDAHGDRLREAIGWLDENGYIVQFNAAAQLTETGDEYLRGSAMPKHGARVYGMGDVVLIKQTVLRGTPAEYVVDEHRERHVSMDDDVAIADAIRAAVAGAM